MSALASRLLSRSRFKDVYVALVGSISRDDLRGSCSQLRDWRMPLEFSRKVLRELGGGPPTCLTGADQQKPNALEAS